MPIVAVAVAAAAASTAIGTSAAVIAALGTFGAALLGATAAIAVSFEGAAYLTPARRPGASE